MRMTSYEPPSTAPIIGSSSSGASSSGVASCGQTLKAAGKRRSHAGQRLELGMPSDNESEKLACELRAGDINGTLPCGARGPTIRPGSVAQEGLRQPDGPQLTSRVVGELLTHDQEHRTTATLHQE